MSIFDDLVETVKDVAEVAIEAAVPILPHEVVETVVGVTVDSVVDVVSEAIS
jgi:phage-related minor tail protein